MKSFFKENEVIYISHPYRDDPYLNYLKVRDVALKLRAKFPKCIFAPVHVFLPHLFVHALG